MNWSMSLNSVHGGKPDVGHLIELRQFFHHFLADGGFSISVSPISWMRFSIRSVTASIVVVLIGRFSQAFFNPRQSCFDQRAPLSSILFTTAGMVSSTRS